MCTAVAYTANDFYFGRTLDYERSYGESVAFLPRRYPLSLYAGEVLTEHYAMLGMAHMADGFPLYYDAVNERGLCIASLRFAGNAVYQKDAPGRINMPSYACIPYLLARCANVAEACSLLGQMRITDTPYSSSLPPAPLHWLLADAQACVVLEPMADGIHLYDNPCGVLTNNPPFPYQLFSLQNDVFLSPAAQETGAAGESGISPYSRGMGVLGLPGDWTSQSRFRRAAFVRRHAAPGKSDAENTRQFFHILSTVEQVRGCCSLPDGQQEYTLYSACINATRGIYSYRTYDAYTPVSIDMHLENAESASIRAYPVSHAPQTQSLRRPPEEI